MSIANGVADDNTSVPTVGGRTPEAVLKAAQCRSISIFQDAVIRRDVDVGNESKTIAISSNWKKKSGAQQVCYLNSGMILALSEGWHFNDSRIWITSGPKLLGKILNDTLLFCGTDLGSGIMIPVSPFVWSRSLKVEQMACDEKV